MSRDPRKPAPQVQSGLPGMDESPAWERFAASIQGPVAGVDEAGRGCIAGPVVAGAVILPQGCVMAGLTDSKAISEARREKLEPIIKAEALAWCVGVAWAPEVDRINILQATFQAMERAVRRLRVSPAALLVDGNKTVPCIGLPQQAVVKGDLKVPAISAASILAKTFRDRIMVKLDARYPGYGFAGHKGYGSKAHYAAVAELGPCAQHRLTFKGVVRPGQTPTATGKGGAAESTPSGPSGGDSLCLPGI